MMHVVGAMDFNVYTPRCYVIAETDHLSESKAVNLETSKVGTAIKRLCTVHTPLKPILRKF